MRRVFAAGVMLALSVWTAAGAKIPREASELAFTMRDGKSADLAAFEGKVIALEFLKTTCPTCKKTAGIMQKLQQEYGGRGFQALGVAVDDDARDKVGAYVSNLNLSYPVGFVPLERAYQFLQHSVMKLMQLPQLVFIDKTGTIRAQYAGTDDFLRHNEEENMREIIEKLLAE